MGQDPFEAREGGGYVALQTSDPEQQGQPGETASFELDERVGHKEMETFDHELAHLPWSSQSGFVASTLSRNRVVIGVTAGILLLLGSALVFFTGRPQRSNMANINSKCVVPLFAGHGFEVPYIRDTFLAQTLDAGCYIMWAERGDLISGKYQNASDLPYGAFLYGLFGPTGSETTYLEQHPSLSSKVVLIDLSNENCYDRGNAYDHFAAVFRNYWCKNIPSTRAYLTSHQSHDELSSTGPYWMPLGYGKFNVLPSSYRLPIPVRPLHWAWIGSTTGKPDREDLMHAVRGVPRTEHEYFHTFGQFDDGGLDQEHYTLLWHKTRFVPLPIGHNAEQFRIWEILSAGVVPVLPQSNPMVPILEDLGFQLVKIANWTDFLPTMTLWNQEPQLSLAAQMAETNWMNLQTVYDRLQLQVAKVVKEIGPH